MRKYLYQQIIAITLFIASGFMVSCKDTMLNNMVDDHVYLLNPGLNPVNVYNFDDPVAYLYAVKAGAGQWSTKLSLEVNQAVLNKYNSEHGTSYKNLNPEVYTLKKATLEFSTSSYKLPFVFLIDDDRFVIEQAKDPGAVFVIPCEVTNLNPGREDTVKMHSILVPQLIEPYIAFTKYGNLTEVTTFTPKSQNSLSYHNKVQINYPNEKDVSYKITVPNNSLALINQYNATEETNYTLLPDVAYTLEGTGKIVTGVNYGSFMFTVLKDKLLTQNNTSAFGKYILPLKIEEVSLNKIHPTNNIVLIPFNYHE